MKKTHLVFEERKSIENLLKEGASFRNIGERIGKSHTTVSREIKNRRIFVRKGAHGNPFNDCLNRFDCTVNGSCKGGKCKAKSCRKCKHTHCFKACSSYEPVRCSKLDFPPYVCNGCKDKHKCTLTKAIYSAREAQKEYKLILKDFREGVNLSVEEYKRIISTMRKGFRKGQSIYHIHEANKDKLMVSKSSLYRYTTLDENGINSIEMPRKARYKKRKTKRVLKLDRKCREGRNLEDLERFLEDNNHTPICEMDTVIGSGKKNILTLYLSSSKLFIARLIDNNSAYSVKKEIDKLYKMLGAKLFKQVFWILKSDNGSEFSNPLALEFDSKGKRRTNIFYCDPYSSYQKGGVENGNSMLRRILPKRTNFDNLNQDKLDLVCSHINSYKRSDLQGLSAYELFEMMNGKKVLEGIGINFIPANEVTLKPNLLD